MMQHAEDPLSGIDGAVILQLLPNRVKQAEALVAETALDFAALKSNPHVKPEELIETERIYLARRHQWLFLKTKLESIQAFVGTEPPPNPS